jgi:Ni,Fe-hydrogenase III small subunit
MKAFILGELEWDSVSHVHAVTAGSTSSVEVERLALLMAVQDLSQLAVTEHNAAAHETVRAVAGHLLEALEQVGSERSGAELANKLVVVDGQQLASLIDTSRHIERGNDLTDGLRGGRLFGEA